MKQLQSTIKDLPASGLVYTEDGMVLTPESRLGADSTLPPAVGGLVTYGIEGETITWCTAPIPPPAPPAITELSVLIEIRDLLAAQYGALQDVNTNLNDLKRK